MNLNVFILLVTTTIVLAGKKTFEGFKIYKVIPKTKDEVNILKGLQQSKIVEFWLDQFDVNQDVRIMVPPENESSFKKQMTESNIDVKELISDVQKLLDRESHPKRSFDPNHSYMSMSWDRYHSLDEIYYWMDELVEVYPNILTSVTMGTSVEGRPIKGLVLRYRDDTNTTFGVLEGTLHAREWISPATVTWILKEFLTSRDSQVRAMAENIEWHIFPVVNPDGYVYSFTNNRMWRKNRNPANFVSCASAGVDDDMSNGIDLNRNFDFVWMLTGASDNPCTNTYAGPNAFSEPEARAIANYVNNLNNRGRILFYYAFHSYTQLFVIPYSHVSGVDVLNATNYADMYEIAIRGAEKLSKRYGTQYRVGVSADVLYPMSGTSFDWVKYVADVPVCYLIELRDLGEYGFLLPPEQIVPNNLEIMDALVEMDRVTRRLGYYTQSGAVSVFYSVVMVLISVFMSLCVYS